MFLSVGVFWQLSSGLLDTPLALSFPCICKNLMQMALRIKALLLKAVERSCFDNALLRPFSVHTVSLQ